MLVSTSSSIHAEGIGWWLHVGDLSLSSHGSKIEVLSGGVIFPDIWLGAGGEFRLYLYT